LALGILGIVLFFLITSRQIKEIPENYPSMATITFNGKVYTPASGVVPLWIPVRKIGVSQEGIDVCDIVGVRFLRGDDSAILVKTKSWYHIYAIFPRPTRGVGGMSWEECAENPKSEISPLCPPICIAPDGRSVTGSSADPSHCQEQDLTSDVLPEKITFKDKVYFPARCVELPSTKVEKVGVSKEGFNVYSSEIPKNVPEPVRGILLKKSDGHFQCYFNKAKFCPDYGDCTDFGPDSRKCSLTDGCVASCSFGCVGRKWLGERGDCEAIWDNFQCECLEGICQRK